MIYCESDRAGCTGSSNNKNKLYLEANQLNLSEKDERENNKKGKGETETEWTKNLSIIYIYMYERNKPISERFLLHFNAKRHKIVPLLASERLTKLRTSYMVEMFCF